MFQKQKLLSRKILKPGKASGIIVGGCLSLVVSTLGTPWEIETKGKILILEDTHEEPYAVDRMLTQLEQAGKLKGVRGIVLGTFRLRKTFFPSQIESVFREKLKNFSGPVLWGVRFGHCPAPLFVPIGLQAKIEGRELSVTEKLLPV